MSHTQTKSIYNLIYNTPEIIAKESTNDTVKLNCNCKLRIRHAR